MPSFFAQEPIFENRNSFVMISNAMFTMLLSWLQEMKCVSSRTRVRTVAHVVLWLAITTVTVKPTQPVATAKEVRISLTLLRL